MYIMYTMYMNKVGKRSEFDEKFNNDLLKENVDLTPFNEPIIVGVKRNEVGGFTATVKFRINYRWATECEWVESNRMFGHKGGLDEEQFKKECLTAIADLQEKRLWIFKANHGLLDHTDANVSGKVRFKA